jgi:hypothetical protein
MESLVESPAAESQGPSKVEEEFFFLELFLPYALDSPFCAQAALVETVTFGVETRVDGLGFHCRPSIDQTL